MIVHISLRPIAPFQGHRDQRSASHVRECETLARSFACVLIVQLSFLVVHHVGISRPRSTQSFMESIVNGSPIN